MHLLKEPLTSVRVFMRGPVFNREDESMCFELPYRYSPFTIASLKGVLEVRHGEEVSYMFAPLLAAEKGILIEEVKGDSTTYHNLLEISLKGEREEVIVKATVTEEGKQRIISINGYSVDFIPEGIVIIFNNHDRPGVIGKDRNITREFRFQYSEFHPWKKEMAVVLPLEFFLLTMR